MRTPKTQPNPPRPPKIVTPKYDLRRNVPAPDSLWNEYSPIKNPPSPFSPQSPRFVEYYKSKKDEKNAASISIKTAKKEEFVFDEKTENSEKIENEVKIEQEQKCELPEIKEIPKEEPEVKENSEEKRTILFIPKEMENIILRYRPFGSFGARSFRYPKKPNVEKNVNSEEA